MAAQSTGCPQALARLFSENEVESMSLSMFCPQKSSARERWLLGFAAPLCQAVDISLGEMYSDSFYVSPPESLAENRQIFRERWGVETPDELRGLIDRGIARPAARYTDRIFLALRDYSAEKYYDIIRQVVPINKYIQKNAKYLAHLLTDMRLWGLKLPDSTVYAFDLARSATLAVQGYWLHYFDKMEAVLILERIARQTSNYFSVWEDYVSSAALGLQLWRICSDFGEPDDDIYKCARMLLLSPESGYKNFAVRFDENVISVSKAAYIPEFKEKLGETLKAAVYTNKAAYAADGHDFYDRLLLCVSPDRLGKDPDPMSEKYFLDSQKEMFPDALVDDLEKWLCTFSAPLSGESGMPANHLSRFSSIKSASILKKLKKEWKIVSRDELIAEAGYIFSDGLSKHNDIVLLQLTGDNTNEWVRRISSYLPLKMSQPANIKKLAALKKNLGYYSLTAPEMTTHAYDMSRISFLASAGYGLGWLEKEEAIELLKQAAWCADKYYGSWGEFFGACIMGRAIWMWSTGKYKDIACSQLIRKARVALKSSLSPCQRYSFKQFFALCERPKNLYVPYPLKNNGVIDSIPNIKMVK